MQGTARTPRKLSEDWWRGIWSVALRGCSTIVGAAGGGRKVVAGTEAPSSAGMSTQ